MAVQDAVKMSKRSSVVYVLGVFTMFGSYLFSRYVGHVPKMPETKPEEVEEPEDPYRVVYETPHRKSVMIYKNESVMISTKIKNVLQWFSGKPNKGDSEE